MSTEEPRGESERGPMAAGMEEAVAQHDALLADLGLEIWLGAEPTFTDQNSSAPEWKIEALGREKEAVARRFVARLAENAPGGIILRTLGRQYPGEAKPRWSIGLYTARDGRPLWSGPPDPIAGTLLDGKPPTPARDQAGNNGESATDGPADVCVQLHAALGAELQTAGYHVLTELPREGWGVRLLFAVESDVMEFDWRSDPRVGRPLMQSQPIPLNGSVDELAAEGAFLVAFGLGDDSFVEDRQAVQIELPAFPNVAVWREFLHLLERAAFRVGLSRLVLSGHPPPVDETVAWTSVTPDPGVLEINMAPCPDVSAFLEEQRRLHAAAHAVGLSPMRLLFNGEVLDSGGGQHLTFGGARPASSPFLQTPHLLPRLIVHCNRHPSLSYWFAVRSVGSCGQQPRADEVSSESMDGLALVLESLSQRPAIDPETLWRNLAPFTCDRFGNTHRCEINVEKLWNPFIPQRGCSGLVELRAFRMTQTPEDAAAIAMLVRSLLASLAQRSDRLDLIDWGSQLHDRFSLPFYLQRDLTDVLAELSRAGFGLPDVITRGLLDDSSLVLGQAELNGARLTLRQAVEFWPVVGDLTATEQPYRLMDSSTSRVEVSLSLSHVPPEDALPWRLVLHGHEVPLVRERAEGGTVWLRGIRYKTFHPAMPVAPLVGVVDPLEFVLIAPDGVHAWRVRLFGWRPDGQAYDGLPRTVAEAQERRRERVVIEPIPPIPLASPAPASALTPCCVDLRRLTLRPAS